VVVEVRGGGVLPLGLRGPGEAWVGRCGWRGGFGGPWARAGRQHWVEERPSTHVHVQHPPDGPVQVLRVCAGHRREFARVDLHGQGQVVPGFKRGSEVGQKGGGGGGGGPRPTCVTKRRQMSAGDIEPCIRCAGSPWAQWRGQASPRPTVGNSQRKAATATGPRRAKQHSLTAGSPVHTAGSPRPRCPTSRCNGTHS
jgi:hypothetical protein